jgi:hypothetical protein
VIGLSRAEPTSGTVHTKKCTTPTPLLNSTTERRPSDGPPKGGRSLTGIAQTAIRADVERATSTSVHATANVTKSQTSTHCSLMRSPVWLRLEGDSDDPATWHPVKVISAQGSVACPRSRHLTWRCECDAVSYGPALGDGCSLL